MWFLTPIQCFEGPFYLLSLADNLSYLTGLVTLPCQAMWKPEEKGKISNIDCVLKKKIAMLLIIDLKKMNFDLMKYYIKILFTLSA